MKAVFLDRDGVINELVYYPEHGIIDSPFTVEQVRLLSGVGEAIKRFQQMGYKVILVSNQPGIAKGSLCEETFEEIRKRMKEELAKEGLLLQAAKEMDIDLSKSWMIGDGLTDVKAGKGAGTGTILLGRMKCELCRLMDEEDARPDAITSNLKEAAQFILKQGE